MIINHNMNALNAHRNMTGNTAASGKSMEKLSSGLRINRAGDDAAGLAISEKMRGQIRGLDQASRNAQDGISMIQTAEGALNETHSILQRMREVSVQSSNGTNTETDRAALQEELNQLTSEINRIGNTTEFNTQKLLNGGIGSGSGDVVTKATGATATLGNAMSDGTVADGTKVIVDNQTFDLSGTVIDTTDSNTIAASVEALKNVTSGGTKLSDVVDITADATGKLTFKAKSEGASSSIQFIAADAAAGDDALGLAEANIQTGTSGNEVAVVSKGTDATVDRAGLQGNAAFSGATIAANDKLTISVGGGKSVDVVFGESKTYSNNDDGRADFVKDLNAALQKAGLDGQVTASVSGKGEIQLISETGKDIKLSNVSASITAATSLSDASKPETIKQVVGPGAQGSGFNVSLQIGANKGQAMNLTINDMRAAALGLTGNAGQVGFSSSNNVTNGTNDIKGEAALNISTGADATKAIETIDKAIQNVSGERSKLGAVQNRLEHTINNLGTSSENLTAAESRIRDVDMAKEMMNFSKNNILSQAAQAMLAQANQQPQGVLQLLR